MANLLRAKPGLLLPLMFAALILLVSLSTLFISTSKSMEEPFSNRSVFSNGPSGYRAWYLSNQKAGLPVSTWEKSFKDMERLPSPATMVIVEPYTVARTNIIFGQEESKRLLDWVGDGNTLVLLDDFRRFGSESLMNALALHVYGQSPRRFSWQEPAILWIHPGQEALLRSYVHRPLLTQTVKRFQGMFNPKLDVQVLLEDASHRPALIRIPYHHGALILGTPVDLAANRYLNGKLNDNFQLLSNILALEKKPIFINEFVHGYNEIDSIFAYYRQKTPLGTIFTQLVFGFFFLLWLSMVRWLPVPTHTSGSQTSTGGLGPFIDSLAGIYYRTQASSLALGAQLTQIESLLRRRYQIELDDTGRLQHLLGTLFADYSSRDESPEVLLSSLQKARDTVRNEERLPHRELLHLSRQLTSIQERLRYGKR